MAGYRINLCKSIAFLYTKNKHKEKEIMDTLTFTVHGHTHIHNHLKENQISRDKLNKGSKQPPQWKHWISEEKKGEIEKDARKWSNALYSWISIITLWTRQFYQNYIQIECNYNQNPHLIFSEVEIIILKFIWNQKRHQVAENNPM